MLRNLLTGIGAVFVLLSCNSVSPSVFESPRSQDGTKDDAIGTLRLYSFNGDSERVPLSINLGHSFISIENESSSDLQVGAYDLEPGYTVSIGIWPFSAHFGLWYNVESNYMAEFSRFEGVVSIKTQIDSTDLNEIDEYIASHDYWTLFKNCSFMALDMYNLAAKENDQIDIGGLITPAKIYDVIKDTVGYDTDFEIAQYGPMGYANDSDPTKGMVEYHA